MAGKIIADKLLSINKSITSVENNPEIQELLSVFGYTHERMEEGKKMIEKVNSLMTVKMEKYSDMELATDEFNNFWKNVYSIYMVTLKVVRVAFSEQTEMLQRFHAIGKRNRSLSGWLVDAITLYTNILNSQEALKVMSLYGYTAEKLDEEFQKVTEVERWINKRLNEKGMAQQATIERDEAFDTLCKWYSKFRAIARIALYEKPQLFEELKT
jgi:hypothetical protein